MDVAVKAELNQVEAKLVSARARVERALHELREIEDIIDHDEVADCVFNQLGDIQRATEDVADDIDLLVSTIIRARVLI